MNRNQQREPKGRKKGASVTHTRSCVEDLTTKLKGKVGFLYRNKSCFSFSTREDNCTIMSALDYGRIVHIHASSSPCGYHNRPAQHAEKLRCEITPTRLLIKKTFGKMLKGYM